jgi:hypothetical protein
MIDAADEKRDRGERLLGELPKRSREHPRRNRRRPRWYGSMRVESILAREIDGSAGSSCSVHVDSVRSATDAALRRG